MHEVPAKTSYSMQKLGSESTIYIIYGGHFGGHFGCHFGCNFGGHFRGHFGCHYGGQFEGNFSSVTMGQIDRAGGLHFLTNK